MKMFLAVLQTLIIVLTAGAGSSGQRDCASITKAMVEAVITNHTTEEVNTQAFTVDVLDFHPVCLAYSQERDRYRYVSVVVEYTCSGNANCPSSNAVEQFECYCKDGKWHYRVGLNGIGKNSRTVNTTADFSTTTREDCAFCLSPGAAMGFFLTSDNVTHCVACDSSCSEGLMRCYDDIDCCKYYNASMCVDTCPSHRIPDDEYNCVCPSGYTGHTCSQPLDQECNVIHCKSCDSDPTTCDTCADGYILSSNECKCGLSNCLKCDQDADDCEECTTGYKLSKGECKKNDDGWIIGVTIGVIAVIVIIVIAVVGITISVGCCYKKWKKQRHKKQEKSTS